MLTSIFGKSVVESSVLLQLRFNTDFEGYRWYCPRVIENDKVYYKAVLEDNQCVILMSTNEFDNSYQERLIGEDYKIFENVNQVFQDFDNSEFVNFYLGLNRYCLPKYIHYNVIEINPEFKVLMKPFYLSKLNNCDSNSFDDTEKSRVKYWNQILQLNE